MRRYAGWRHSRGVDASRIALVGRSHSGSTVLSALDRTDDSVAAESIKPVAAVAYYPGCGKSVRMGRYDIAAPLLVLVGEADDWTPAIECRRLVERLRGARADAPVEIVVYPDAHHGFDSLALVRVRDNVATTRSGKATVGGNPVARLQSRERIFAFLAQQFGRPPR